MSTTVNRLTPPVAHAVKQVPLKVPTTTVTGNGLPIHLIGPCTQDVIRIEMVTDGGAASAPRNLIASYTAKMLTEGTASLSAAALAARVEHFGATIHAEADQDESVLTLTCLGRHLNELLPLLSEAFISPIFPEKEFDTLRQNGLQELRVNRQKVAYLARTAFAEALYGADHPYGRSASVADYNSLETGMLRNHHSKHIVGGLRHVMVAGMVNDRHLAAIIGALSQMKVATATRAAPTAIPASEPENRHAEKEGAVQNAIRVGRLLFTRDHPDFIDMSILTTVLGGHFGSRLMNNLREEKGYTYGVNASIQTSLNGGHLVIGTEVGIDVCTRALDEIWVEIDRLRTEEIPAQELDLVRNYLIGRALSSVDGPFALADKWRMYLRHGLNATHHHQYIDRLWQVPSDRLLALAKQYLNPADCTVITAGKA